MSNVALQRGHRLAGNQFNDWLASALRFYSHPESGFLRGEKYSGRPEMIGTDAYLLVKVALHSHLGLPVPQDGTFTLLKRAIEYSHEFFFGSWRESGENSRSSDYWRRDWGWLHGYHAGLLSSLIVGDGDAAREISKYPDIDCDMNEFEVTKEDLMYLILLARWISGRNRRDANLYEQITRGRRRRAKLLLTCLDSLIAHDSPRFGTTITDYLKHFTKSESQPRIDKVVSIDGSILWNLADCNGLELPILELRLKDVVVTPVSMGIVTF
jgi:hypothetical protein